MRTCFGLKQDCHPAAGGFNTDDRSPRSPNSSVVAIRRHASAVTAPCTNTTSASRSGSRRLHAPLQKEGTGMAAYHFASSSIACRRLNEMGVGKGLYCLPFPGGQIGSTSRGGRVVK